MIMYKNPSVMDARVNNPEIIHAGLFWIILSLREIIQNNLAWIMEGLFKENTNEFTSGVLQNKPSSLRDGLFYQRASS